jgi:hypothetical protein
MKKKPLSIIIIAMIYFFLPVGNLIQAAFINDLPILGENGILSRLLWSDWIILCLFPVAGLGVYRVRKWGWYFFVVFSFILISYNLVVYYFLNPNCSFEPVLLFILIITGMSSFFFRKHVYAPYFNPRLRCWEAANRYRIPLSATIFSEKRKSLHKCQVLDISVTGCFIDYDKDLKEGNRVWLKIDFYGTVIQCSGQVVRKSDPKETHSGYGIMFKKLAKDSKKKIRTLVRFVERLGYQDRADIIPTKVIPKNSHDRRFSSIHQFGRRIKSSVSSP